MCKFGQLSHLNKPRPYNVCCGRASQHVGQANCLWNVAVERSLFFWFNGLFFFLKAKQNNWKWLKFFLSALYQSISIRNTVALFMYSQKVVFCSSSLSKSYFVTFCLILFIRLFICFCYILDIGSHLFHFSHLQFIGRILCEKMNNDILSEIDVS